MTIDGHGVPESPGKFKMKHTPAAVTYPLTVGSDQFDNGASFEMLCNSEGDAIYEGRSLRGFVEILNTLAKIGGGGGDAKRGLDCLLEHIRITVNNINDPENPHQRALEIILSKLQPEEEQAAEPDLSTVPDDMLFGTKEYYEGEPEEKECPQCGGLGWVDGYSPVSGSTDSEDCPACNGTGKVKP